MKRQPHRQARRVALCGIFCAIAFLLLMGSGFLPVSTFSGPIFASLCLVPIVSEFSPKTALTAYLGISLLALFFVPDREVSLFFTLLTGYYPVLQPQLAHISKKWLRLACKFGLLVVAVSVYFAILLFLFSSPALWAELSGSPPWFLVLFAAAGCLLFFLYDVLVDKVRIVYLQRFRKHLFR